MAIVQAIASAQLEDSTGEVGAFDQPVSFDNTVATLGNITSWVQGLGVQIDTVADGRLTKLRIALLIPLPSGLKSAAGPNDIEETGLITFNAANTPHRYGVDVPSMASNEFNGPAIILSGTPSVAGLVSYLTAPTFSITPTDRYGNALTSVSRARKTFRKHRRALVRA